MRNIGLFALLIPAACVTASDKPVNNGLNDTEWVLIGFYEGSEGTQLNDVPLNTYIMHLDVSGGVQFKFDCNQGTSSWTAASKQPGKKGSISFGKIAVTEMLCGGESIGETVSADMTRVDSYSIYDGRLSLSLQGMHRVYVWDAVD